MYPLLFPNIHYWWFPIGNTPAVDFLKDFTHDTQTKVRILLLGCGDPRSILYTTWCERGAGEFIVHKRLHSILTLLLNCRNPEIF